MLPYIISPMGSNYSEKNNANPNEAKNSRISDFNERKEANGHVSNQRGAETRKNLIRELLNGLSNDHLQKLITYKKELMAAQLEQDVALLETENDKNNTNRPLQP